MTKIPTIFHMKNILYIFSSVKRYIILGHEKKLQGKNSQKATKKEKQSKKKVIFRGGMNINIYMKICFCCT